MVEEQIELIIQKGADTWGRERLTQAIAQFLRDKSRHYEDVLEVSQSRLLQAWEQQRDYSAINYYQEANFPDLKEGNVYVFDNLGDYQKRFPSKKFICPACEGVSTNPYECNSGEEISVGKVCDWKVYGFFRDLGKGVYIFLRQEFHRSPKPQLIFKPIELKGNDD